jgi:hypothetical protein
MGTGMQSRIVPPLTLEGTGIGTYRPPTVMPQTIVALGQIQNKCNLIFIGQATAALGQTVVISIN